MKKILCVIDSLCSGGAQRQFVGLSLLLKEKGYNVTVLTYHDIPFFKKELEIGNIEIKTIASTHSILKRILSMTRETSHYHPDVVISYQESPSFLMCIVKFLLKCSFKLIVSERNVTLSIKKSDKLRFLLYRLFADSIVPNSYTQTQIIKDYNPQLSLKVTTITNFVDVNYFKPSGAFNSNGSNLKIIVLARISEQKNTQRCYNAICKLNQIGYNIQLDWYGRADSEYGIQTIKYIEEENKVFWRFKGEITNVPETLQYYDVLMLPSIYEGYSNVICESLSCGIPVICSDISDNPYIVKDCINGFLFNPMDEEDMVHAIKKFMQLTYSDLRQMRHNNRERAVELFSKEKFVNNYIRLIEYGCN